MSEQLTDRERFYKALESLNSTQRQSVLSPADTLQVLAGPGSGKTRVLTLRVAYLVIEKNIYPGQIVVVTFTTKAANEMKTRLVKLIGLNSTNRLLIGTFHAICSRILHQHAGVAGLDPKFTICDTDQSKIIISKIQKDQGVKISDYARRDLKAAVVFSTISKAKSEGMNEEDFEEANKDEFKNKDIAVIFKEYEKELDKQNLVDFDNLLLKCCLVLKRKKNVLAKVKAILVDEYQDTNVVQYDLIKLMMNQANTKTVTIVGDPDQSIFGWRSAEPKNFSKMAEEFRGNQSINMEQNYRSTSKVIDAAVHVITQDKNRIDKSLYTNNPEGVPMSLIPTYDSESQAKFVATEIQKAIKFSKGLIQHKDIAILMRMNFISQQFENTFRLQKIPFTMVGGDRFFDRIEVKDMTSYLLFSYNPKNTAAFTRIVNVPKRGIGEVWMKRILDTNLENNEDLFETLKKIVARNTTIHFTPGIVSRLNDLVSICTGIRSLIDRKREAADILSYIYRATDYFEYLKEHYFKDHESRWQNLSELLSVAKRTNNLDTQSSNSFYNENGFEGEEEKEVDEDEDMSDESFSDFSDIDIDRPLKTEPERTKKATRPKKNNAKTEDSVKKEKPEFSVKSEKLVKSEHHVKLEDVEENYRMMDEKKDTKNNVKSEDKVNPEDDFGPDLNPEDFDIDMPTDPIAEFLEYCSLCSNQKEQEEAEGGKVTIATMHSSKGLEWPCVFVVSCNEGVVPHFRCEDIDEEGRLLYVAMTRSKFLLYCVSTQYRDQWGQRQREELSRFLKGMKKDLYSTKPVEWDSDMRTMLAETIGKPVPERDDNLTTRVRKPTNKSKHSNNKSKSSQQSTTTSSQQSSGSNNSSDIRFGVSGKRANLEELGGFSSASSSYKPHNDRKKPIKTEVKQEHPKSPSKKTKTENNNIKKEKEAYVKTEPEY